MADIKLTAQDALAETPATGDLLYIVDISDTTDGVSGSSKKITRANLVGGLFDKTADDLDDITAGTTNKHFTASDESKLDGIEALADVTDAGNVGSSIHGATAKTTPVDADTTALIDSAASNALKKVTWANIKATLKTYFDTLYNNYVHPNHSGDVTSVADGATTIANDAVTYAKMQNVSATDRILGRDTTGAGDIEEITPANVRTMLNVADGANAYVHPNHSGDVTSVADGATTIANDAVTYAKMQNVSATDKLLGRVSALAGDVEEITFTDFAQSILDDADEATFKATVNLEIGTDVQAYDADLGAIAGLSSNGIIARTGAGTASVRTITGTSNEISVSNGDGVSGNPTLSLPTTIDLGGKDSLEIPNSATPTVNADGEIALDTTVTDWSHGIIKYFGGEEMAIVAMPVAQLTSPTDTYVVKYVAAADEFQLAADAGAGGGINNVVEDTTPQLGGNLDLNTFTVGVANAADLTKLNELTATSAELNYVDGVTSAIQTQIDGKQPLDSDLTTIAGLTPTTNNFLVASGSAWASRTPTQAIAHLGLDADIATFALPASTTITTFGASIIDDTDEATFKATVNLEIGTDVQAYNADLTSLATNWVQASASGASSLDFHEDTDNGSNKVTIIAPASVVTSDKILTLPDATDTLIGKATTDDLTNKTLTNPKINEDVVMSASATELNILDGATLSTAELNYVDGVTSAIQTQLDGKQPIDSDLTTIAGLTPTTNNFMVASGSAWASRTPTQAIVHLGLDADIATFALPASTTISAFGATIVDDADAAAVRTTLGLVIGTNVQAFDADLTSLATNWVQASASGASSLDFHEDTDNGSNKITLIAPATIASDKTVTFQDITGTVVVTGGADLTVADGGTGASTLTGLLQGNGTSAITGITNSSTVGQVLRVTGASTYAWGALDLADTDAVTGTLPAGNLPSASTTASGVAEAAIASEVNTGTDTARYVTPDALAGSNLGTRVIAIQVLDGATAWTTGDGKAYVRIPAELNGYNVIDVDMGVITKSTSGNPTVQIARGRQANATTAHAFNDVLSTALTIDANDFDSKDAGTAAVVNASNDDLATGDILRVDIDTAGTGTAGFNLNIIAQLP